MTAEGKAGASGGRAGGAGEDLARDEYFQEKLQKYDRWMREGKIPHSAKVVPVGEAFGGGQWVLPTQQALEILRNARGFAVADCACRSHYRRCKNPVETCLVINDVADQFVAAGNARRLSLDEAAAVLRLADHHGLVHLSVYNPEQYVWAVCSCCRCCCNQLRFLLLGGRDDLVVRADYVARLDGARCAGCAGMPCVGRCPFGAHGRERGGGGEGGGAGGGGGGGGAGGGGGGGGAGGSWRHVFAAGRCYGCGLCVTTCPRDAVRLAPRRGDG